MPIPLAGNNGNKKQENFPKQILLRTIKYKDKAVSLLALLFFQCFFQIFIPQPLLFLCKMNLPKLLRIILIIKHFLPELLTGQVKDAVPNHIIAVIISTWP